MEVREIVETVLRDPILEVHFRLDTDADDVIRISEFVIDEIEDYGYSVVTEEFDLFGMDDDWDEDDNFEYDMESDDKVVDEDELISFMNEFFLITGDIPDAEFF